MNDFAPPRPAWPHPQRRSWKCSQATGGKEWVVWQEWVNSKCPYQAINLRGNRRGYNARGDGDKYKQSGMSCYLQLQLVASCSDAVYCFSPWKSYLNLGYPLLQQPSLPFAVLSPNKASQHCKGQTEPAREATSTLHSSQPSSVRHSIVLSSSAELPGRNASYKHAGAASFRKHWNSEYCVSLLSRLLLLINTHKVVRQCVYEGCEMWEDENYCSAVPLHQSRHMHV